LAFACFFAGALVIVVFAVVVLPLVDTVVVALVLPDFVVTVFDEAVGAATAGLAISAAAATDAINFFIASSCLRLESAGALRIGAAASQPGGGNVKCRSLTVRNEDRAARRRRESPAPNG